jgi:hypothetical protein
MRYRTTVWLVGLVSLSSLLTGCGTSFKKLPSQEKFGSTATYSRSFDTTPAQTCEAARRALLSQGYVINTASDSLVSGQKSFQPEVESHLQLEIRVVCVPDSKDGKASIGFVTALQDRYAIKKSNNTASLGVGVIGSVSLPFSSSSDSMVKIGSETIVSVSFYDSFFNVVKQYLVPDKEGDAAH